MDFNRRHMLGGAAALAMLGAASPAFAEVRRSGGGRGHARALEVLRRYVEQHRADWGLPGMTVCAVDRDGFAGFITSGWANRDSRAPVNGDHLFQVGSISKVFTALTAASLAQEGRLSLDAKVRDLMPETPIAGGGDIAVQHLLNHTSGLPSDPPLFPPGGLWVGFAPGSRWSYSNTGYLMAGMIAARSDGRPLHESMHARVLRPLGMTHSLGAIRNADRSRYAQGYEPLYSDRAQLRPGPLAPSSWVDFDNGAGSVAATAGDMALFLRFLLELAQGRGGPVLSDAAAAAFLANPADAPAWSATAKYGNGLARLEVDGRRYLHHTGGMVSFSSSMHVDAEAGVAAFASSNVSYGLSYRPRAVTLLACQLLHAARAGGPSPAPLPTRPRVERAELYAGAYTSVSGENFEIRADGERIAMRYSGRDSDMQPVAPGAFACSEPRFEVPGLIFDFENETVVRAWAHAVEFVRDPARGYRPAPSSELQALAGTYVSDDRWSGTAVVVARDGRLWLHNSEPLTLLDDGAWRVGEDDWSPERARFDGVIAGRPTQMWLSGSLYTRRFG
jgi:CubicO group peptidase (beta-lactamase class C family)